MAGSYRQPQASSLPQGHPQSKGSPRLVGLLGGDRECQMSVKHLKKGQPFKAAICQPRSDSVSLSNKIEKKVVRGP